MTPTVYAALIITCLCMSLITSKLGFISQHLKELKTGKSHGQDQGWSIGFFLVAVAFCIIANIQGLK